ncbi:MAG: hypothetical protein QOJ15_5268 [Bradyrhizobium sp.]|nr:hypothetical protein [Bradyrhizobium sp.]
MPILVPPDQEAAHHGKHKLIAAACGNKLPCVSGTECWAERPDGRLWLLASDVHLWNA